MTQNLKANLNWEYKEWEPLYELVNKKNGLREFVSGKKFDQNTYSVVRVIDQDHCVECMTPFSDHQYHQQKGYFNASEGWMCKDCFIKKVK